MCPRPTVPNSDIRRLQDEGYEVEVHNGYLLVHSVPYVTSNLTIAHGIVVSDLNGTLEALGPPRDHQVWFAGEYPCHQTGRPLEALRHSGGQPMWDGFDVQHRFSNKPEGGFKDYYTKMKSYISIIANEAKGLDPTVTPCTWRVIVPREDDNSVFKYFDSASSRANIIPVSEKLEMDKVAIIGLGGTGSYVLDLISKTRVKEIHLFDGDIFSQHNAFRSPGAATVEVLNQRIAKVDYYSQMYSAMRRGVIPHYVYIMEMNLEELSMFDFVFLCVDTGLSRKLISIYLRDKRIPFVDVGMDIQMIPEDCSLIGTCRATLATADKHDHFDQVAPQGDDTDGDLYRSNIQVADMNALNATLAVIKWKQFCRFYSDRFKVHHTTYSVDSHSLTRDATPMGDSVCSE